MKHFNQILAETKNLIKKQKKFKTILEKYRK